MGKHTSFNILYILKGYSVFSLSKHGVGPMIWGKPGSAVVEEQVLRNATNRSWVKEVWGWIQFFLLKSQALICGTHAWDPGDGWAADGGRVLGALLQIGGVDAGVPPCTRRRPWLGHLLFSDPQVSPLPWNFVYLILSIKKKCISIGANTKRSKSPKLYRWSVPTWCSNGWNNHWCQISKPSWNLSHLVSDICDICDIWFGDICDSGRLKCQRLLSWSPTVIGNRYSEMNIMFL